MKKRKKPEHKGGGFLCRAYCKGEGAWSGGADIDCLRSRESHAKKKGMPGRAYNVFSSNGRRRGQPPAGERRERTPYELLGRELRILVQARCGSHSRENVGKMG